MTHDTGVNRHHLSFAAMNVLEGKIIGSCYPRHRNNRVPEIPPGRSAGSTQGLDIHLNLDNYDIMAMRIENLAAQLLALPYTSPHKVHHGELWRRCLRNHTEKDSPGSIQQRPELG